MSPIILSERYVERPALITPPFVHQPPENRERASRNFRYSTRHVSIHHTSTSSQACRLPSVAKIRSRGPMISAPVLVAQGQHFQRRQADVLDRRMSTPGVPVSVRASQGKAVVPSHPRPGRRRRKGCAVRFLLPLRGFLVGPFEEPVPHAGISGAVDDCGVIRTPCKAGTTGTLRASSSSRGSSSMSGVLQGVSYGPEGVFDGRRWTGQWPGLFRPWVVGGGDDGGCIPRRVCRAGLWCVVVSGGARPSPVG